MTPQEIAEHSLDLGARYPFDAPDLWGAKGSDPVSARDWAHAAARGVLADLTDRRGVKRAFNGVDQDVRADIIESLSNIIRAALAAQPGSDTVQVPKHPTQAMRDVMDSEGWAWEDLLAAADAITEDEYAMLVAAPTEAKPAQDAVDAARYRLLRRGQHWSVIDGIGNVLRGDDLDAAISAKKGGA